MKINRHNIAGDICIGEEGSWLELGVTSLSEADKDAVTTWLMVTLPDAIEDLLGRVARSENPAPVSLFKNAMTRCHLVTEAEAYGQSFCGNPYELALEDNQQDYANAVSALGVSDEVAAKAFDKMREACELILEAQANDN